jgi:hypothetical protein
MNMKSIARKTTARTTTPDLDRPIRLRPVAGEEPATLTTDLQAMRDTLDDVMCRTVLLGLAVGGALGDDHKAYVIGGAIDDLQEKIGDVLDGVQRLQRKVAK